MIKKDRYIILIILVAMLLIASVWFFYERKLDALEKKIGQPP